LVQTLAARRVLEGPVLSALGLATHWTQGLALWCQALQYLEQSAQCLVLAWAQRCRARSAPGPETRLAVGLARPCPARSAPDLEIHLAVGLGQ
jgi:hypothetical protein